MDLEGKSAFFRQRVVQEYDEGGKRQIENEKIRKSVRFFYHKLAYEAYVKRKVSL